MDTPTPIQVDLGRIAQDLQIRRVQVESVVQLLDEGNTVPFITRYRKERTGNLSEVAIREIQVRVGRLRELAERKETILKAIEAQGKLNDDLRAAIRAADNPKRLEDLYLPFKPKKKTKASEARERGLEPLALAIWNRDETLTDLPGAAQGYLNPEKELDTVEKVLEGVGHILAEAVSELAAVRDAVRRVVWRTGKVVTTKADIPEGEGLEYRDYFAYSEPVAHIPPHRVLAINRGDKEGPLKVRLEVLRPEIEAALFTQLPLEGHPHSDFFRAAALDALDRLLLPSLEREVRRDLTDMAERHAVDVFARNLRSLLLQPPIPRQVVMAIDPGFRTGCKVAVLDANGNLLDQGVIHPHPPQNRRHEAKVYLKDLVGKHNVGVVAIGNGTACRETEELIAEIIAEGTQFHLNPQPPAAEAPALATEPTAAPEPAETTPAPQEAAAAPQTEGEAQAELPEHQPPPAEAGGGVQEHPPGGNSEGSGTGSGSDHQTSAEAPLPSEPQAHAPASDAAEPVLPPISGGAPDTEPEATLPPASAPAPEPTEPPPSEHQPSTEPVGEAPASPGASEAHAAESPPQPEPPAPVAEAEPAAPGGETPEPATAAAEPAAAAGETPAAPAEPPVPSPAASFASPPVGVEPKPKPASKPSQPRPPRPRPAPPPPAPHPADALLAQLAYVIVNEAGASVYSTSPIGREEFPEFDATLRSAISIGRRLQDPLSELVKIEPQNIGVGLYQHDVNPKQLKESLESVIESCVNFVGVDLNTASVPLLRHVSGLNQLTARRLVDHRKEKGAFTNRQQLMAVDGIGPATFTQSAGFLKITAEGENPFDRTWIHPESYAVAEQVLQRLGFSPEALRQKDQLPALHAKLNETDLPALARELGVGEPTLHDIFEALARPERDPRDDLPKPIFKKGVLKLEDLSPGMELKGTVLNVVDFGAFVDIGLKDSGLVHISQLANRYIKSPHDVVSVGDVVTVWVMGVDQERKRVSLTMVKPGTERPRGGQGGGRRPHGQGEGRDGGERRGGGGQRGPRREGGGQRREGQPAQQPAGAGAPAGGEAAAPRRPDRPAGERSQEGQAGGGRGGPGGPRDRGRGGPRTGQGPGGAHARMERAQAPRPAPRPSKPATPPPPLSKDALSGSVPLRTFGQLKQLWQARSEEATPAQAPESGPAETAPAPESAPPAPEAAASAPAPAPEPEPEPAPAPAQEASAPAPEAPPQPEPGPEARPEPDQAVN